MNRLPYKSDFFIYHYSNKPGYFWIGPAGISHRAKSLHAAKIQITKARQRMAQALAEPVDL